jgi:hypothetical protein
VQWRKSERQRERHKCADKEDDEDRFGAHVDRWQAIRAGPEPPSLRSSVPTPHATIIAASWSDVGRHASVSERRLRDVREA